MKKQRKFKFGPNCKWTYWGKRGCSHGMYSSGGFDYWVYGIKGIISFEIMHSWGDMTSMTI